MPRRPTLDEINAAVAQALAGHASLETLVCRLVKGRDPHPDEPAWPAEQRRIWVKAVELYMKAITTPREPSAERMAGRPSDAPSPSVNEVWAAIERASSPWWELRRGWAALAALMGMHERRARYWLCDVQGWRFAGQTRNRVIVMAPCAACGTPTPREQIRDRRCLGCQSPMGDTDARLTKMRP